VSLDERLRDFDRYQQRRPRLAFVLGVYKKFADDEGPSLAALISYYGFVSLFPLLLVMVTILGFVLQNNPKLRDEILNGTLGQIPLISDQINHNGLQGSGFALAIGIILSVLAGLGVMSASQNAFNRIWTVPRKERPNFIFQRLRSLVTLAVLGSVVIVSTFAAGFVGSASHGAGTVVGGILVAFAANVILFMSAFKLLTAIDLGWRKLLPGVVVAAVGWQLLQHLGGYYLEHTLKRTGPLYGVFALVLGLLGWLYLGGQIVVFAAEINVVKDRRLWPRSLFSERLKATDKRALEDSAKTEERVEQERVEVGFDDHNS
jgi:YihY family inner membrane protein